MFLIRFSTVRLKWKTGLKVRRIKYVVLGSFLTILCSFFCLVHLVGRHSKEELQVSSLASLQQELSSLEQDFVYLLLILKSN